MKHLCFSFLMVLIFPLSPFVAAGQSIGAGQVGIEKTPIRFITVTGTAEKEVTPDIIDLNLTLKEYFLDKDGKSKVFIDDLEKNFQRVVIGAGIPAENITIESISGFTRLSQRKKNEGFLASKTYKIKLSDLDKVNLILDKLDNKAVTGAYIGGYDYSQIDQVKKDLRIKAMLQAKAKATYALGAVGENIGTILEAEIDESNLSQPMPYQGMMLRSAGLNVSETAESAPSIDFKKIKLTASVRVKFQIR